MKDNNNNRTLRELTDALLLRDEKLLENEKLLSAMFSINPVAMILTSVSDGSVVKVNRAFEGLSGYSEDEILGKTTLHLYKNVEDRARVIDIVKRDGSIKDFELQFVRKDGQIIDGQMSIKIITTDKVECFLTTIVDVTERNKAEAEIRRLASFPILNPNPIIEITLDGNVTFYNPIAKKLFPDICLGHVWFKNWEEIKQDFLNTKFKPVIREFSSDDKWYLQIFYFVEEIQVIRVYGIDITERKAIRELLEESEGRYRRLFEAARDGILILDAETGIVVDVNPYLVELLGHPREKFLGKAIWDLGFFKDVIANQDNFLELQQKKYIRYEDLALETHDGRRAEVEFVSNVYLVNNEKVIQCNIRDVSKRKLAEAKLREKDAFIKTVLDNLPVGVAVNTLDEFHYMNDKFLEFYRTTREELTEKGFWDAVYEEIDFREEIKKLVIDDCSTCDPTRMRWVDVPITRKGEETTYISARNTPLPLDGKTMISTVWDVTWRKKAEERVERDLSRLRSLVSIFQYPAKSIQDLLDYALEQAIQITESKIGYIYHYHEDRKEFVLNTWSKEVMAECAVANPPTCYELDKTGIWGEAVRQRKPIVVNNFLAESPLKKGYPAGHVQLLKFMTVPIFKDGAIVGVVGLANKETNYEEGDILQCSLLLETVWRIIDRKEIEQSLEQIAGEKEETRIELVETAKEKEETRKELIKTANALKEIATEKEETRIKLVETAELLKQIAGEKEKETRLNKILLDALPCVAILLRCGTREIIAMNKVAEEAGCRIGQTCYGSWPKLNEPCSFCQAPEACATCTEKHAVVEADGIIWDIYWTPINNDLFMHYAFDITELKRAKEVLKKVQETLRTTIGNVEVKKILVIDDNEDYINMMKFLVSRSLPGCEVFVSMDGEQGIEIAKKEDPEVILLDIIMPKMNGFEVCKQIKADEQLSSIPIIFMTGMSTIESSRIKALEAGGDLFLSKPVNSEELITQVKAMAKIKASNRLRKFEKDSQ